ncbi:hypothetical protein R1sor_018450 [Riccia sorocarpa]|uniref:Uncharacterized protein n=1 Tax=Riccia sorocarpa TaxID=122646 RepID=A0ABD3I9T9_9MARC
MSCFDTLSCNFAFPEADDSFQTITFYSAGGVELGFRDLGSYCSVDCLAKGGRSGFRQSTEKGYNDPVRCYG